MNEKSKREPSAEKKTLEKPEVGDESSRRSDRQKKSYYYDDDCGYETYVPGADDDEDSDAPETPKEI